MAFRITGPLERGEASLADLSLNTAWNETAAFVKREARLLLPTAFLLIALPAAVLQALVPSPTSGEAAEPSGWLFLLFIPMVLISIVGTLAITNLALRPGLTVGEAIRLGVRRLLPLIGATLLLALGIILLMIPLVLLAMLVGTAPAAVFVLSLLIAGVALFLWVRLMFVTPVAAVENEGPVGILRRSWRLSGLHVWQLLGFILLVVIVFIVLTLAVSALAGIVIILLAGQPEPGSFSSFLILLVGALLQAVLTVYFICIIARIYAQLAGWSGVGRADERDLGSGI
jgi:hypothetical protein